MAEQRRGERAWLRREINKRLQFLQPLEIRADNGGESDLKVHTIQLLPEPELDSVAVSFTTRRGTLSLLLTPGLAADLADGLRQTLQQLKPAKAEPVQRKAAK
jgi:hypothetical protein